MRGDGSSDTRELKSECEPIQPSAKDDWLLLVIPNAQLQSPRTCKKQPLYSNDPCQLLKGSSCHGSEALCSRRVEWHAMVLGDDKSSSQAGRQLCQNALTATLKQDLNHLDSTMVTRS